jgi:hypothetical protein
MRHEHWYWVAGGAIFVAIVCIWVWQLPNIIAYAQRGKSDDGLSAIMSSLGAAGGTVKGDMADVQNKLDANLNDIDRTLDAQSAQAAAIDDLKKKMIIKDVAKDIQAATVPTPPDHVR